MSLRLMVVGHSYVTAFAQRKYAALKQLDPEVSLRLIIPDSTGHVFGRFHVERAEGLDPQDVAVLPHWFGRSHMSYCHPPLQLAREIRRFQPDIIHIEEDPYSATGLESLLAVRAAWREARISFFTWDNLNKRPRFPLDIIKRTLTAVAFQRAQLIVCGNRRAEELLRTQKRYRGLTRVLPQVGLDETEYGKSDRRGWRERHGLPQSVPIVGYVGRLLAQKGVPDLIAALEMLGDLDWRFVVVGAGALEPDLMKASEGRLRGRLLRLAAVPHREVPELLEALDLFVLPSRTTPHWIEQFGLTLAQAMMAGVACVGSSSGAIPEVIGDGGLVVPEADPPALAAALRRMITEPDTRAEFAVAARARALAHFTNHAVAAGYLDAFRKLATAPLCVATQ